MSNKVVYSVIEIQTNENCNLSLHVHNVYNELAHAKEKFATIYKEYCAHNHIPQEFSSAMMDRQFTCVGHYGSNIYKLVKLVESEVR